LDPLDLHSCPTRRSSDLTRPLLRIPAVSIMTYSCPSSSIKGVSIASRVVPSTSETITRCSPKILFTKLDFPTFGRPIKLNLIIRSEEHTSELQSRFDIVC